MKTVIAASIFLLSLIYLPSYAQPYITGETTTKVFSEDFSDISKSFPITSSKDPKFWGTYGDGYYFMERKIERPRVVLANFNGTSKNFYLKTKIQLGPVKSKTSSLGILFLTQTGGRGGFLLEINKKKQFRIKDIGNNTIITNHGKKGWIKSKSIFGVKQNNKVEIKAFRGKFDIYFNNEYVYSFINKSYKKGAFGAYIGGFSEAKIIYFNVYALEIPSAPEEIELENLLEEIKVLRTDNDSLKIKILTVKYGGKTDKSAISAIKILEDQITASRNENLNLKKLLTEYETMEPSIDSKESEKKSTATVTKITTVTNERDSLKNRCETLEKKVDLMSIQIEEVKFQLKSNEDTITEDTKEPAKPSEPVGLPSTSVPSTQKTKKEVETKEKESLVLLPLSDQNIPVQKAVKGEFKD
jgi:hypothetical protein